MPNNSIMGQPVNLCINGITKAQATKINEIDGIKADIAEIESQISGLSGGQWIELPFSDYEEFAEYLPKIINFETGTSKYDILINWDNNDNKSSFIFPKNSIVSGEMQYSHFENRNLSSIDIAYYEFDVQDLLASESTQIETRQHLIIINNTNNSAEYTRETINVQRTIFKIYVFASDIENL